MSVSWLKIQNVGLILAVHKHPATLTCIKQYGQQTYVWHSVFYNLKCIALHL